MCSLVVSDQCQTTAVDQQNQHASRLPYPTRGKCCPPRVHPVFSPITPAPLDLMDIDLEEFGEISEMTHSWPSPGPISPTWSKGEGKGSEEVDLIGKGKGRDDLDSTCKDLIGKGKGQKGRGTNPKDEEEQVSDQPVHSSQRVVPKHSGSRGKNLAALARIQKEELDFSTKPRFPKEEQDDVSSSSDTKTSKPPLTVTQADANSSKHSHSSTSSSQKQSKTRLGEFHDKMKTIDETVLQEIQSIHRPLANKILEEADPTELEELAKSICKTTTESELSAFVTRALDLSVENQVYLRYLNMHPPESLHPNGFFWLYILGVQFNFYQNITEICIFFSNKVLGTTIHCIFYSKHLAKICQL